MEKRKGMGAYLIGMAGFVVALVVLSAVLSPPVYGAVDFLFPDRWPFKRVFNRVLMVTALVCLWPLLRYWGVRSWRQVGIGDWGSLARRVFFWFGVGMGMLLVLTGLRLWFGVTDWLVDLEATDLLSFAFSAVMVGVLEEVLFRGGFCLSFSHLDLRGRIGVVLTGSLFFATSHFLTARPLDGGLRWDTGFQTWMDMAGQFQSMPDVIGHWVTLFLASVLLSALALRQGVLWGAIGLHAGWVFTLKLSYKLTEGNSGALPFWFGENVLTGLATAVVLLLGVLGVVYARRV